MIMSSAAQRKVQVVAKRPDTKLGEKEERSKRAALYARVSTEDQAEKGYSLGAQDDRLRAYAVSKGWEVVDLYVDDGYTGRDIKRPEYTRMFEEIDSWEILLVYKMDRIHRNQRNFTAMMDDLVKRGKVFASVSESLDGSTAMGQFVMGILQEVAQLESRQIGERVKLAFKEATVKRGKRAMGQASPWGYRWSEGDPKHGTGRLLIDEERVNEVRRVFALWNDGMSAGKVSAALEWCTCEPKPMKRTWTTKDGITRSKVYQAKDQKCGGCHRVRYIVNNPAYCGYLIYMGEVLEADHTPIITREIFEAAQARRRNRRIPLPPEK